MYFFSNNLKEYDQVQSDFVTHLQNMSVELSRQHC